MSALAATQVELDEPALSIPIEDAELLIESSLAETVPQICMVRTD